LLKINNGIAKIAVNAIKEKGAFAPSQIFLN